MEDIKKSVMKLTKNLTKTSGELVKTTKLSLSISSQEEKLNSIYLDIGKKVHEIYMYGGTLGKFFDEKYREIDEIERHIKELRNELDIAKGTKSCPNCKKTSDRSTEFCPKCGFKMDGIVNRTRPKPEVIGEQKDILENAAAINTVKCRVCGTENGGDTKFCISCGRFL